MASNKTTSNSPDLETAVHTPRKHLLDIAVECQLILHPGLMLCVWELDVGSLAAGLLGDDMVGFLEFFFPVSCLVH